MENKELKTVYDMYNERLNQQIKSDKEVRKIGFDIIEKMKLIDDKTHEFNPNKIKWSTLDDNTKQMLTGLYRLKQHYSSQLGMIFYILGKNDSLVDNSFKKQLNGNGLDEKYYL